MIWNYRKSRDDNENFTQKQLENYLNKISDKNLYSYNVYQQKGKEKNYSVKLKETLIQ